MVDLTPPFFWIFEQRIQVSVQSKQYHRVSRLDSGCKTFRISFGNFMDCTGAQCTIDSIVHAIPNWVFFLFLVTNIPANSGLFRKKRESFLMTVQHECP